MHYSLGSRFLYWGPRQTLDEEIGEKRKNWLKYTNNKVECVFRQRKWQLGLGTMDLLLGIFDEITYILISSFLKFNNMEKNCNLTQWFLYFRSNLFTWNLNNANQDYDGDGGNIVYDYLHVSKCLIYANTISKLLLYSVCEHKGQKSKTRTY